MTIICGPVTGTISGSNSILCGKLIRISDIRQYYDTIDITIEGQNSPQVGDNSFTFNNERYRLRLISKNVGAFTAVVELTISTVPPPEKWRCSDPVTNTCIRDDTNGTYNNEAECKAASSCQPSSNITHHLDLVVKPYSWYSPGGTADLIVTKLADVDGALANLFVDITDYQYINTEILSDVPTGKVTIRVNLKQMPVVGMVAPLLLFIIPIVAKLLIVLLFAGIITGWKFTLSGFITEITGKEYSKKEVVAIVEDEVVPKQRENCRINFAGDPDGLALCEKSVQSGAADGLTDALGLTGTDATTLQVNSKIDSCLAQYHIDGNLSAYYACLDDVAKTTSDGIKAKTPETGSGGMGSLLLLAGVGILGLTLLSKGGGGSTKIIETVIPSHYTPPEIKRYNTPKR